MRCLILLLLLFALTPVLLLPQPPPENPSPSPAGSADWDRVGALVHDQEIVVSAQGGRNLHCLFTGASNDQLFCEPPLFRQYEGEYHVERADVETVRLDQVRHNWKILIWTCAAAGTVWGATDNRLVEQGSPRVVNGFAGGLVGGLAGLVVGLPVALFIPGKLVYRHPHWAGAALGSPAAAQPSE
jgi:hypothetical protein